VAVARPEDKRLEDEQVERSLEELNAIGFGHTGRETTSTLGACLLERPQGSGLWAQGCLRPEARLIPITALSPEA
jgi:hypothetical protein